MFDTHLINPGRVREGVRKAAIIAAAIGILDGTTRATTAEILQHVRNEQEGPVARTSESLPRCFETAATQLQMNRCARDEAGRADAELDRVLRALLTEAAKEPPGAEKVRAAHIAWLTYRDAYLEATYPARDKRVYGSIYPMERDLLLAKLTTRQEQALRQMLDRYTGADKSR